MWGGSHRGSWSHGGGSHGRNGVGGGGGVQGSMAGGCSPVGVGCHGGVVLGEWGPGGGGCLMWGAQGVKCGGVSRGVPQWRKSPVEGSHGGTRVMGGGLCCGGEQGSMGGLVGRSHSGNGVLWGGGVHGGWGSSMGAGRGPGSHGWVLQVEEAWGVGGRVSHGGGVSGKRSRVLWGKRGSHRRMGGLMGGVRS